MKIYKLLTIAIISVFFMSACWQAESTNVEENRNTVNSENAAKNVVEKTENTGDNIDYEKLPETSNTSMNPTETIMAFNKATFSKNAARIKSFLTKGSMEMVEKSAKEQGKTVDSILTEGEVAVEDEKPNIRNEKINGDTATVEVKNQVMGNYDLMYFVKEDGIWKVALDKVMEEMMKKLNEGQMQVPDAGQEPQKQAPDSKGKNPEKK